MACLSCTNDEEFSVMSSNYTLIVNSSHLHNETGISLYVSNAQLRVVTLVLAVLLIPLFCLLGSVGNILSLVILIHQRMRNQTNYILAALCVSDTLFLVHCLIFTGINVHKKLSPVEGENARAHIYPILGAYGSVVTARITSCLTTLLCMERFVAVFFPMQARTVCSKRNTCIAIAGIYILTFIAFIPFSIKYEAVTRYDNHTVAYTTMNTTSFYENNLNFYKVYGTILNIIFRFAPLVIIPILNVIMIRVVHITWKKRRHLSADIKNSNYFRNSNRNGKHSSSSEQQHITIMLLTVSFIFLICILPGALNSLATHVWCTYNRLGKLRNLYMVISTVTFLLETINSSVNFIIYMALNRKFRLLYKEIFCCGHGKYYRKISISSVKERFRWSSNKKQNKEADSDKFGRQTVSDIGPLLTETIAGLKKDNGYYKRHSEGFDLKSGTTVSLEDYFAYHNKKRNMQNGLCCKNSAKRSSFRDFFRLHEKCETNLSIDEDNGNNVICSVGVCPVSNGLTCTNGPTNI